MIDDLGDGASHQVGVRSFLTLATQIHSHRAWEGAEVNRRNKKKIQDTDISPDSLEFPRHPGWHDVFIHCLLLEAVSSTHHPFTVNEGSSTEVAAR